MNSANQHLPQIWIPVAIYLIAMLYIGYYSNKIVSASSKDKFSTNTSGQQEFWRLCGGNDIGSHLRKCIQLPGVRVLRIPRPWLGTACNDSVTAAYLTLGILGKDLPWYRERSRQ